MSRRLTGPLVGVLVGALAVVSGFVAWPLLGDLAARTAVLPDPERLDVVVVPHSGDEFSAWSLVEDDPTSYKVFVLLTGSDRDVGGWVTRFRDLARVDETLPTGLTEVARLAPFPDEGGAVCRRDTPAAECRARRTPRVWTGERGALVAFDLGAEGLTRREVLWAVRTVKRNREALSLDTTLRPGTLIGAAFANTRYACVRFEDADHLAVHQALFDTDLHFDEQLAPTCAGDPDAGRSATVSARSTAAFLDGGGLRVHGGVARVGREGQRRVFHTEQSFWVRFQH